MFYNIAVYILDYLLTIIGEAVYSCHYFLVYVTLSHLLKEVVPMDTDTGKYLFSLVVLSILGNAFSTVAKDFTLAVFSKKCGLLVDYVFSEAFYLGLESSILVFLYATALGWMNMGTICHATPQDPGSINFSLSCRTPCRCCLPGHC